MNKHGPIAVMAGALVGLLCAAATTGAATSATVNVTITVLPFAEVRMDSENVEVYLPAGGGNSQPVYVGGTVTANCSVMLLAEIKAPSGAPGRWFATPMVAEVAHPGTHFDRLVRINVLDVPPGYGGNVSIQVFGSKLGETPMPNPGQVVVTLMQN